MMLFLFICHKIPPFDVEKPAFSSGLLTWRRSIATNYA
jgi:hypothetical protein